MDFGMFVWEGIRFLFAATLIVALSYLPIFLLLRRHLALLQDPSNLLRHGVVVRRFDALTQV